MATTTANSASAAYSTTRSRNICCLSADVWRTGWKLFHIFGNNCRQLHHPLTQFGVARNIALNVLAAALQLLAKPVKLINETLNFTSGRFRHLTQKCAKVLARNFAVASFRMMNAPAGACQSADIPPNVFF